MSLWLAIGNPNLDKWIALGVEKADSENQALYQFMGYGIYPAHVIELPDSVMRRVDQNFDGPAYDG